MTFDFVDQLFTDDTIVLFYFLKEKKILQNDLFIGKL